MTASGVQVQGVDQFRDGIVGTGRFETLHPNDLKGACYRSVGVVAQMEAAVAGHPLLHLHLRLPMSMVSLQGRHLQ